MILTKEKPNPKIKLTDEISTKLVAAIPEKFKKWDEARNKILEVNKKVEEQVYFNSVETFDKYLPNLLETKDAYKAHYWNSAFKVPASTFSINLPFQMAEAQKNYAAIQKTALLKAHKKAGVQNTNFKALENWIVKGEFILYVTWEEFKTWSREVQENEIVDNNGNPSKSFSYQNKEILKYKGPKVLPVIPEDFVFDVSKKKDFDTNKCAKIYRSWATSQEIIDNEIYKECLKNEKTIEEIENLTSDTKNKNTSEAEKDKQKAVSGDQIQILEYWGDIKIDKKFYKNMIIAIAGGKHVIRFEENPWVIQPFVYCHYYEDPKTKRGYGPLVNILGLNNRASSIFEIMHEALKLILNPPWLTPKGSGFIGAVNNTIKIVAGKVIEYGANNALSKAPPPRQMEFRDALTADPFMQFLEKKMESVTLNKYAAGDTGAMTRTATEAGTILSGQNIKTAMWVWLISEQGIIPTIQKMAFYMAHFMDENEPVKLDEDGSDEWQMITKEIRSEDYEYSIGNSGVILELKNKLPQLFPIMKDLQQILGVKFSGEKIWNIVCLAFELEDPKDFLESDPLQEILNQIPQEEREPVKQMLANLVTQKIQEFQASGSQPNTGRTQPQAMGGENVEVGTMPRIPRT